MSYNNAHYFGQQLTAVKLTKILCILAHLSMKKITVAMTGALNGLSDLSFKFDTIKLKRREEITNLME